MRVSEILTPAEVQQRKDDWADKCRMRMRPDKTCIGCGLSFPNTREHFGSPVSGRVMRRCVVCQKELRDKHFRLAAAGPRNGDCPMCDSYGPLVLDHQAPAPVRLCRYCLHRINQVFKLDKMSYDVWFFRARQYADWRYAGMMAEKSGPQAPEALEGLEGDRPAGREDTTGMDEVVA